MDSNTISFNVIENGSQRVIDEFRTILKAGTELPVLDEVLTPSDAVQRAGGPGQATPLQPPQPAQTDVDIDLGRFDAWLNGMLDPSGWSCHSDSVRAQLESVVSRLPPPPSLPPSRFRTLNLPTVQSATPQTSSGSGTGPARRSVHAELAQAESEMAALPVAHAKTATALTTPVETTGHVADLALAALAEQAAKDALAEQVKAYARLEAELASQIEQLTRRAEAAEAKVNALELQIAADRKCADALGRRFGQTEHELFPAFVARLGMTAKAASTARAKGDEPTTR